MIKGALRASGAFTPRGAKTPGSSKTTREERLAALGDGSRRDDGDSQKRKPPQ